MSVNHSRKEAAFFRAAAQIVGSEITNSNVSYTTVTGVKLSPDGSHLTIFVAFDSHPERSLEGLNAAKGFVRSQISRMPDIRRAPEIHFKIDESLEVGTRIEHILANIKKEEAK